MSGFDWLNLPVNQSNTPAPQVSFNVLSDPPTSTINQLSNQNFNDSSSSTKVPPIPPQPRSQSMVQQNSNSLNYNQNQNQNNQNYNQVQGQGQGQFHNSFTDSTFFNNNPTGLQEVVPNFDDLKLNESLYSKRSHLQSDIYNPELTESVPLSLTTNDLTLQELKTYIRWYTNILSRTNTRTISMNDIFNFFNNFKIPKIVKDLISNIFKSRNIQINVGEFFAILRLIAHGLNGATITRGLIKASATIPKPPSILSKKRQSDDDDDDDYNNNGSAYSSNGNSNNNSFTGNNNENGNGNSSAGTGVIDSPSKRLDLDSFTTFMLTGERPTTKRKKKNAKSVKFIDEVVSDIHESIPPQPTGEIDYSLPMDQILQLQAASRSPQPDEEEVLKDMNDQLGHFQNLNSVDSVSIGGKNLSVHLNDSNHGSLNNSTDELLKPNMTGPAQMSQFLNHLQQHPPQQSHSQSQQNQSLQNQQSQQQSQTEELKPNRTGPYDMIRMFAPDSDSNSNSNNSTQVPKISLSAFTDQMTGTGLNTNFNSITQQQQQQQQQQQVQSQEPQSFSPLPVPSISPRIMSNSPPPPPRPRAQSSPTPANLNLPNSIDDRLSPRSGSPRTLPPPPPPRRRGASFSPRESSSPALPPKVPDPYAPLQAIQSQSLLQPQSTLYPRTASPLSQSHDYQNYQNLDNGPESLNYTQPTPEPVTRADSSTTNILDDLKALQAEVDKIRDMTGGF